MSYPCPATDCPLSVGDHLLMCRKHWRQVPAELQVAVWRTYRARDRGDSERRAHLAACRRAIKAVNGAPDARP